MEYKLRKIFSILLLMFIFPCNYLLSQSNIPINNSKASNSNNNTLKDFSINQSFYILGPGDKIEITFVGLPELSGIFDILSDGNIELPLIGTTNFKGLTLNTAKEKLIKIYETELISPQIYLNLSMARPLKVSIIGEVLRPGPYTLDLNETNRVEGSSRALSISGYPTLVDAIQKAGGLTLDADITNIKLSRLRPGKSPAFKKASVNLLEMIQTGNQVNNPILFDGDIIDVKKITDQKLSLENIPNNLTPETINLYIIGEVESPGTYKVASNTKISQAILMAGGPRTWRHKNKVQLLRVKRNGSVETKKISYSSEGFKRNKKNISLRDGDVIRVNKNLFGKSTDALGTFLPPIRDLYSLYGVYKLID